MADAWFNDKEEYTFGNLDYATFEYEYQLSRTDVIAFLATDIPLSFAGTMDGNLLAQTFAWKYGKTNGPYLSVDLPLPSQRGHEWHEVPEYGWPVRLLQETVALEEGRRLTREMLRGNLPSIGY
jgi:hypothetical protein